MLSNNKEPVEKQLAVALGFISLMKAFFHEQV
jgi:hypothetical protein